jgi:rhamnogalacturonyl hydrolase YesR
MSDRLIALQKPDGYWPPSLLAPENTPPETSGTGFFVYGLAYGLNHGLLKGQKYETAMTNGWNALAIAVQPDGKLGWVQQIGYAPDHVEAGDTQLYGVGAFLLAASEVGAR